MRVILKQSVPHVGEFGEAVEVKDGYARNFLFPQGLAEPATPRALARLEELKHQRAKEHERRRAEIAAMLERLEGYTVTITAAADDEGTLYGSVSSSDIANALQEQDFTVEHTNVRLGSSLKEIGEHEVTLDFGEGDETRITVVIDSQEE